MSVSLIVGDNVKNIALAPNGILKEEVLAVNYIVGLLVSSDAPLEKFSCEYTTKYLNICYGRWFRPFCRLKLSGKAKYIELTLSSIQIKQLYSDPRFVNYKWGGKRFSKIPINNLEDIKAYADLIPAAFQWSIINYDF